jgi:hypothetical protein
MSFAEKQWVLFNAANSTILDTNAHNSNIMIFDSRLWYEKITFSVENNLDAYVTLTFYGARDLGMAPEHQLKDPIVVPAGLTRYMTLTDFFAAIQVSAQCGVAPTTGFINMVAMPVMHDSGQQ